MITNVTRMARLIESAARDTNDDPAQTFARVLPSCVTPEDELIAASVIQAKVGFGHYRREVSHAHV